MSRSKQPYEPPCTRNRIASCTESMDNRCPAEASLRTYLVINSRTTPLLFRLPACGQIRLVIHSADDIATCNLPDEEGRWPCTMFLQSLGNYLDYSQCRSIRLRVCLRPSQP